MDPGVIREGPAVFRLSSPEKTIELGRKLGALLQGGDVLALVGELGSGKTWFAKGVALGLGVSENTVVTSPSFSLVNEYEGRCIFFHMDAYRLDRLSDFVDAGLEEYLYGEAVAALEWADRWPEILPPWTIHVRLDIMEDLSRRVTISGSHGRALAVMRELKTMDGQGEEDEART